MQVMQALSSVSFLLAGFLLIAPGVSPLAASICELPPDPGPCDGNCIRWYHDSAAGECWQFLYGCCAGNSNNFEALEECEATCPCVEPGAEGVLLLSEEGMDVTLSWEGPEDGPWDIYRETWPDPTGWWLPFAAGVGDGDPGTPGVQFADEGGMGGVSLYYYQVRPATLCD